MKKTFITFAIIVLTISHLQAQNSFNEEVFTAMMNRLQKDPAFFKNEAAPNFTAIFGGGSTATQDGMLKFAENNVGLYKRKQSNLKVSQVGNTGIATGIVEETFLLKENPTIVNRTYKGLFTYTFSQVNGKWLWVSAQHTDFKDTKEADEAAIKQVIEAETVAGWERDTEKEFSYWNHVPNASFIGAAQNNAYYVLGFDNIKSMALDYHKKTPAVSPLPTLRNSDYVIKINGNDAFVTYRAEQQFQEGKANITRENRYLEKVSGNWKITNVTWIVEGGDNVAFTDAVWRGILDEYKKDSHAFMNNRLSEDWRYINSRGAYQYQKDFLGGTAQNMVSTDMLQPVIFQSGDLAITSGVHHTVLLDKDGKEYSRDVAATYTWQRRNGKWMFVASQQTPVAPSTFDEATFNQMVARWGNDPAGFVQNECDKKFIFTDGNGKSYNYDQAIDTYKNAIIKIDKKIENLKVWQSGSTGIATGKTIETFQFKEGKPYTYTGLFTYTFSQSNGKWILASAQHTDYKVPKTADK